jgi:parallel beta-helix repeat protein
MNPLRPAALAALLALAPGALAGTLHVDAALTTGANDGSSWANAFRGQDGLQAALAAAVSGDRVFVAQGVYRPNALGDRTDAFRMASGVEIYGGFAGGESDPAQRPPLGTAVSVLSGDLAGNDGSGVLSDNAYHVVRAGGADASAVLDGFTITGGNANGASNNDRGGGMISGGGATVTIRGCRFVDNRCTFGGGAVYVSNSAPSFTDCSFESNVGGAFGGAFDIAQAGAVRFDRCRFTGNQANRAGALEIFATSGIVVTNCLFQGNTATGSGGGGAIWMGSGGNTVLANCTVVGNTATAQAQGGLRVQGANPTVVNSIFWDNAGPGGAQGSSNQIAGTTNVTYTVVEGGLAGTGNLAVDPLLDAALAPGAGSPVIDAGSNAGVPAGVLLDLAGSSRFVDDPATPDSGSGAAPLVDLGAFEFGGGAQVGTPFCSGDGSGTPCPCGNAGAAGSGCGNGSFAAGATLSGSGVASVSADSLVLEVTGTVPSSPGIFFQGDSLVSGGAGNPLGDGLLCAGAPIRRTAPRFASASGTVSSNLPLAATLGVLAGQTKRYQWWYRDAAGTPCGNGFNLSNGLEIVWAP